MVKQTMDRTGLASVFLFLLYGLYFLGLSTSAAQSPPTNQLELSPGTSQAATPAAEALPTYTNPRFGLSFQVPVNYTLIQGQGAGARAGDFSIVPGDSGEYVFAKLERTTRFPAFPILTPSAAALYFGVHLGISEEACLAPLNFTTYKTKGAFLLDGVAFHWSADPFPENVLRSARPTPFAETYLRDYAGFANSVCYEFHLRTRTSPRENALADFEAVLSTLKIFPRTRVERPPGEFETPFPVPSEILGLLKFAPFQITYPKIGSLLVPMIRPRPASGEETPQQPIIPSGGVADLSFSNSITFSYFSDLSDGDAATAAITKLQQDVVRYLEGNHWSPGSQANGAVSALRGTYRKDGALLEITQGTDRCTMNSPCTQFDQLTISVFLPVRPQSAP